MKQKCKWLLLLYVPTLCADQYSFLFYNDVFAGTDKHFTNGVSISWLDNTFENRDENKSSRYSALMFDIADSVPFTTIDRSRKHTAGISLSQMMITPSDKDLAEPQYDDVPYVGYLALSSYFFEWDDTGFDEYRMELGVVGVESGVGSFQKAFHRIIGVPEPQGWDTQLGTQWTLNLLYRRGFKTWRHHDSSGLSADWFNHIGFQAGNFITDVFAGTIFRFGQNYAENFNVHYPYLKEEASLLRSCKKHHGFGWSLSAGASGEMLGYSYILDEAEKEGYDLKHNSAVLAFYLGGSLYMKGQKVTFFYQSQSPYIGEARKMNTFGGFILAFQF